MPLAERLTDEDIKKVIRDSVSRFEDELGSSAGFILRQEVCLNAETDVQCGSHHAMALRRGEWVKVDLIRVADADG